MPCPVKTDVPKVSDLPLANEAQMKPRWPRAAPALMSCSVFEPRCCTLEAWIAGGAFLFSWRCYGRQIRGGLTAAANSDHPEGD